MKIAIITSRYPSKNEPYNHMFVHMRSLEMLKKGEKIKVFVPAKMSSTYTYEGVSVIMLPSKEIIKKITETDVVYLHLLNIYPFSKSNGWHIYQFLQKSNIPFAMYVHGSEVQKYGARMFEFNYKITDFLKWFKKDILVIPKMRRFVKSVQNRKQVTFIYPSLWMKRDMEINLNLKIKKYHIIPNGIDTELFKYHNLYKNKHKLLNLRPLSSKKYAVDVAIEIMRYLPEEYELDIFGKGHYLKKYLALIEKYKLSDRIHIKNTFIDRNELNSFFANYGIFLSPTRMDAQGVTMCEAMASGLLTISNNNTAIPEFITNNKTGIIGNNPKEIAKQIIISTTNKDVYAKLTQSARASMENIDSSKTVEKEIKVLKSLIR